MKIGEKLKNGKQAGNMLQSEKKRVKSVHSCSFFLCKNSAKICYLWYYINMEKGKVIMICGKICSGKTFYANTIKSELNAVILSCDEVTSILFDNNLGEKHDEMAKRIRIYLFNFVIYLYEDHLVNHQNKNKDSE